MIPADMSVALNSSELEGELLRMTDRYTDELICAPDAVAATFVYPVSSLVVDPERFPDDAQEPMSRKGMGIVYTRTADGRPLRAEPSTASEKASWPGSIGPTTRH